MTECKRRAELGLSEDYLYTKTTQVVTYKDFINKELVLFSNMDNERSISSAVDGLKPGSRKVTCLFFNYKLYNFVDIFSVLCSIQTQNL